MIILSLLLSLFAHPALALGYSEHIDYLSKIVNPAQIQSNEFNEIDLSHNPETVIWLKDLDQKLAPTKFGTYDADLLINFDKDGQILAISISELREQNLEKFKDFIAKLRNFKANTLPPTISPETTFKLNATTLYIDRDSSFLTQTFATEALQKNSQNSNLNELINYFKTNTEVKVELIKPHYIDYPQIGESIVFKLLENNYSDLILYGNIIEINNKALIVKLNRVNDKLLNLVYRIDRPKKDSCSTFSTVINSGIASAINTGLTASTLSNGIIPGVLAVTSMTGTLMQEQAKLISFNLAKGDKVILTKGEKQQ